MPQLEPSEIIQEVHKQWSLFLDNDLPVMKKALEAQKWIRETQTTDVIDSETTEEQETEEGNDE